MVVLLLGLAIGSCELEGAEPETVEKWPEPNEVTNVLRTVTDYEVGRLPPISEQGSSWRLCTFYSGALAAYHVAQTAFYRDLAFQWAETNNWEFRSNRRRHADFQCIGQVFLELYLLEGEPYMREGVRTTLTEIVEDDRSGSEMWSWADALFMAPPVWARLGATTQNMRFFDFMSTRFWEASKPLFDPEYSLYYRDERFINRETSHGAPVFWSRGNGWVLAGIVRVIQYLPDDHPARDQFLKRYKTMAATIASLQHEDGLWRTSLLDPHEYPAPETSGTGLFTYALAWGLNQGHLAGDNYRSAVLDGWKGLVGAVDADGRLGWVQTVGSRPGPVSEDDTGAYGVGAFLLAGSEVLRMVE